MKKQQNFDNTLGKAYIIYYVMLLFAIAIITKILIIQFNDGDELRARAEKRKVRQFTIQADRGNIYSTNGDLIATSLPRFDIFVDFSRSVVSDENFKNNIDSLAFSLSNLFNDRTEKQYRSLLLSYRRTNETYGIIKKNISFDELKTLRTFPLFRLGRFRGGLIVEKREKRVHPNGMLAQRTIGFSRENFHVGIEGSFDKQLTGKDGRRLMQRLPGGRYIPVNDDYIIQPIQGVDIVSTLDMQIQDVAHNSLLQHLIKHGAEWGCVVIMEVETGEVKAIANLQKNEEGVYHEYFNHAIGTRYEPGSSFKLFSMLALIEEGGLNLDQIVKTGRGKLRLGKYEISDVNPLGDISVRQVFEKSSNVGTIMLVMDKFRNQQSKFVDRLYKMDLNKKLGIEIRGEQPALIDHPRNRTWSRTSLPSMSIGYGVAVTPLQILSYYNAVANGGKLIRPKFIREFRNRGEVVKTINSKVINPSICSKETSLVLSSLLRGVVEDGTARNLKNASVKIAGKTATARASGAGGYIEGSYVASFVGFFPYDNPKYSGIVVVNKPQSGAFQGGAVAAPVFKDIAELIYSIDDEIHNVYKTNNLIPFEALPSVNKLNSTTFQKLLEFIPNKFTNIQLEKHDFVSINKDITPIINKQNFTNNSIPDLTGMNIRDAIYLLESKGCIVVFNGKGRVIGQSIPAGTPIRRGMVVSLNLKSS